MSASRPENRITENASRNRGLCRATITICTIAAASRIDLMMLMMSCRRPYFRNSPATAAASKRGAVGASWLCHRTCSSSNGAMAHLRHSLLNGVLDARDFDSHVIDRKTRDFRNFLVAEGFQQERDDQPVLIRQLCDGAAQRREPLRLLQVLVRGGRLIRRFHLRQRGRGTLAPAIQERRIHRNPIKPSVRMRVAPERG